MRECFFRVVLHIGECRYELRRSPPGYKQAYKAAMPLLKLMFLFSLPISLFTIFIKQTLLHRYQPSHLQTSSFLRFTICLCYDQRPAHLDEPVNWLVKHFQRPSTEPSTTFLHPCISTWPTTSGPTLQPCVINSSNCIPAANAPTTHTLSTAAHHMADPVILFSSERYSSDTSAQHTQVMAPSTHHSTATPTVATTVATQAQGAIDEQLCLQQ